MISVSIHLLLAWSAGYCFGLTVKFLKQVIGK